MSKKIRKPNKPGKAVPPLQAAPTPPPQQQVPPLGGDADSLVTEWRRLQGILAKINEEITDNQKKLQEADATIKNLQNQGNQILGSVSSVSRILSGMGVNPENHTVSEPNEVPAPLPPAYTPEEVEDDYPVENEVVKGDFRSAVARRRFHK